MRRVLLRLRSEQGTSLVELGLVMGLLSIIGIAIMSSLSTSARATAQVDDQNRGLADLQVVTERMTRDLRAARAVDVGATASLLTLWIDDNSDYKRQDNESVTWRIPQGDAQAKQFDVERVVGNVKDPAAPVAVQVVGKSLVSVIAFEYYANGVKVEPAMAKSVRVSMKYDAVVGAYSNQKQVDFEVRLRNVQ